MVDVDELFATDDTVNTIQELCTKLAKSTQARFKEKGVNQVVVNKVTLAKFFGYSLDDYREYLPTHIRRRLKVAGISVSSTGEDTCVLMPANDAKKRPRVATPVVDEVDEETELVR